VNPPADPGVMRTLADADWLRTGALARLLAALSADGEEARVVGGAVRNALLKLPPGDIDISITAPSRWWSTALLSR
jgi:hypothetical protein